jgi:pimeloyl-ACP methyl ester carboxylesterase
MKKLSLFALLLLSTSLHARTLDVQIQTEGDEEEYKCEFAGVKSLDVTLYPDRKDSKKFSFKYQIVGNLDPEKIVIIYLPGGPGGSSMNDFSISQVRDLRINRGLPADVPWIMIDPRTVGCNRGDEDKFPDDSLTSEYLAHDVLSVIQDLKLKKYIIHGHSYGSQAATFVAGLAAERSVTPPHAIFLSGILGKGKADGSFGIPFNMILQWELIKATLSPEAIKILSGADPLGVEDSRWGSLIGGGLYEGYVMSAGVFKNPLLEKLQAIDKHGSEEQKQLIEYLNAERGPRYGQSDYSDRLFAKVDCHEFSPNDGTVEFVAGNLVPTEDPCVDDQFDRPYDSAKFEITSPIYYLAGTADPAAPYEGARYHFENQKSAQRNFMSLPGGGHTMFGYVFQDCKDAMWNAIYEQRNLDDVLPECSVKVKLEMK